MRSILLSGIACLLVGCGGSSLKEAGEECVASSECAAGLVCDLGASPPVCAGNVTADALQVDADETAVDAAETDAPPGVDAAQIDAAQIDARVIDAPSIDAAVDAETDAPPDA